MDWGATARGVAQLRLVWSDPTRSAWQRLAVLKIHATRGAVLLAMLAVTPLLAACGGASSATHTSQPALTGPRIELVYRAQPAPSGSAHTQSQLAAAAKVIGDRLQRLGQHTYSVAAFEGDEIRVELPTAAEGALGREDLGARTLLSLYDWETQALTPNGQTVASQLLAGDPTALSISQDSSSGSASSSGLPLYDAVKLAATQPRSISASIGRTGDEFYLFGAPDSIACVKVEGMAAVPGERCLLAGPIDVPSSTTTEEAARLLNSLVPVGVDLSGASASVLAVKQGTVVLQAEPVDASHRPPFGYPGTGYFVLRDQVALNGGQIGNVTSGTDSAGQPTVSFGFTAGGAGAFQQVTAAIARRGALNSIAGQTLYQHFAIAVGRQLVAVPSVDFKVYPNGISGNSGVHIVGGLTVTTAQSLANELRVAALPAAFVLVSAQRT
jgi:preprotein translocase subunit SecD